MNLLEYKCKEHYGMGYIAALKKLMVYAEMQPLAKQMSYEIEHAEKVLREFRQERKPNAN